MSQRSPGQRVKGELSNTKHRHFRVLAEHIPAPAIPLLAVPPLTGSLAEVIAPPAQLIPGGIELPELAEAVPPKGLPPGVTFLPPGGGIVTSCCAAGPPPPPPPPPPAVPEPETWMTMLAGFGIIGWFLRRDRRRNGTGVSRALDGRGLSAGQ